MATNILVESTASFEDNIAHLSIEEKAIVNQNINELAKIFSTHKADIYSKLHQPHSKSKFDDYESSLYILSISEKLNLVLAIDEDPIFAQVIFTLFRVVQSNEVEEAYQSVSDFLYQDMAHLQREVVHI